MVLSHLPAGVGDQLVTVVKGDPKTGVGQHLGHGALHFNQFFFGHGWEIGKSANDCVGTNRAFTDETLGISLEEGYCHAHRPKTHRHSKSVF